MIHRAITSVVGTISGVDDGHEVDLELVLPSAEYVCMECRMEQAPGQEHERNGANRMTEGSGTGALNGVDVFYGGHGG